MLTAQSGHAGLEVFNQNKIDLVVTDLHMPGGTGIDVVRRVRESSDAPIIVLTGYKPEFKHELRTIANVIEVQKLCKSGELLEPIESALVLSGRTRGTEGVRSPPNWESEHDPHSVGHRGRRHERRERKDNSDRRRRSRTDEGPFDKARGAGIPICLHPGCLLRMVQATSERPDLLLLDINMPAGTGFSVQQRLQSANHMLDIAVIYITGEPLETIAHSRSRSAPPVCS